MNDDALFVLRPALERTEPIRNPGGFLRTTDKSGKVVGGVPLVAAEDAVVAAVRLAYKVADAQIKRSARLARRLRQAGDQAAGPKSGRKALDASEQLVFRAMLAALGWIEGLAAEEGSPLQRWASAQYQLFGNMLGVTPRKAAGARAARNDTAERPHPESFRQERTARAAAPLRIVHRDETARAVKVLSCEVDHGTPRERVYFHHVPRLAGKPMDGALTIGEDGNMRLSIAPPEDAASGVWRAAVCDAEGVQLGVIEIEL
jgi:hypothetical protein